MTFSVAHLTINTIGGFLATLDTAFDTCVFEAPSSDSRISATIFFRFPVTFEQHVQCAQSALDTLLDKPVHGVRFGVHTYLIYSR